MLGRMGVFGDKLRLHREAKGVSGYLICQVTSIPSSLFVAIEKGRRAPSDANLEALAAMPELGVTLEQLQAWRDLDRIGVEGLERIKRWVPEAIEGAAPAGPKRKETSDAIAQVLAELPAGMKHPPTEKELKLLEKIGGFDGSELDPRSNSPLWQYPPAKRLPELRQAEREWDEDNDVGSEKGSG
jgi:transcriptional regulator with XRE-family HTH domain